MSDEMKERARKLYEAGVAAAVTLRAATTQRIGVWVQLGVGEPVEVVREVAALAGAQVYSHAHVRWDGQVVMIEALRGSVDGIGLEMQGERPLTVAELAAQTAVAA